MLVYRITQKKYTDHLFAPGLSGRWNRAGKKVLYCAESIPLAFLECMIRRQGAGFNRDFNIVIIEAPDDLAIKTISLTDLKEAGAISGTIQFAGKLATHGLIALLRRCSKCPRPL
jgi:RES domain-containing protein